MSAPERIPRLGFLAWIERERRVDSSRSVMEMALYVRVRRRDGTEIQRRITDLQLASSRRAPLDLIAAAFPDPIDRIAIQLQGCDLLAALPPIQGSVGSLGRSDSPAPPARRSGPYRAGERSASARPRSQPQDPSPGGEILAPPSDRVPFYRPR